MSQVTKTVHVFYFPTILLEQHLYHFPNRLSGMLLLLLWVETGD